MPQLPEALQNQVLKLLARVSCAGESTCVLVVLGKRFSLSLSFLLYVSWFCMIRVECGSVVEVVALAGEFLLLLLLLLLHMMVVLGIAGIVNMAMAAWDAQTNFFRCEW